MRSHYKKLGLYIREISIRNTDLLDIPLLGVSIQKVLIPSIANIIGTDMVTYKIIKKEQFAYGPVTSRNGDKISVALCEYDKGMVSQAYVVFEVIDHDELDPEYLMMWFRRPEFDRYARFKSHGSAREIFDWNELCEIELPISSIEKQREIVKEYHIIVNRIKLNEQLNQKLEETAQALYKHWFVDFEFPDENGKPYKSNGGEMVWWEVLKQEIPTGWLPGTLADLVNTQYGYTASANDEVVGPKFLRITDIASGKIDWDTVPNCIISENEITKYLLIEGDIVVARTGATVGYAKRINKNSPTTVFASFLVRLIPFEKIFNFYIGLSVVSVDYRTYILNIAGGSAQPQANAILLTTYPLLKPDKKVIEKLNIFIEPILDHIELLNNDISKLTQLKNFLLAKMSKPELLETAQPA
jgi:type I restriction enzyme S subunit